MQKGNGVIAQDYGTDCRNCERYQKLGDVCVVEHGKKFLWEYCRDFVPQVVLPDYKDLMRSVRLDQALERKKLKDRKDRERRKKLKERREREELKRKNRRARLRKRRERLKKISKKESSKARSRTNSSISKNAGLKRAVPKSARSTQDILQTPAVNVEQPLKSGKLKKSKTTQEKEI